MKKPIVFLLLLVTVAATDAQVPRFYLTTYIHHPAGGKVKENHPAITYQRSASPSLGLGLGYHLPVRQKFSIDMSLNYHFARFAYESKVFSGTSSATLPLLLVEPCYHLVNSEKLTLSAKIGTGIGKLTQFDYIMQGSDTINNTFLYAHVRWLDVLPAFVCAGLDLRFKRTRRDWAVSLGYRHGLTPAYRNTITVSYPDGSLAQSRFVSKIGFVSLGVKYFTRNKNRKKESVS